MTFSFCFNGCKSDMGSFVSCFNLWPLDKSYGIQLELACFGQEVQFLDLTIYLDNRGQWDSKLFSENADKHAFPHPGSFHPGHIEASIPRSAALRCRRPCSEHEEDLRTAAIFPATTSQSQ